MFDIGIPEIIITDKLRDADGISIKYKAEATDRPVCTNPSCSHTIKPHRHTAVNYLLHDVKSESKLVYIDLCIRRYKCPECGNVFPDQFTFFTKKQHLTHRLKEEIVNRCIKGETFRYIANDYLIDPKTVSAIFEEYVNANKELLENSYTPEILGIDEAHIDAHYRLVLTDIKNQRLLDMKKDNHLRTVKTYLKLLDKSTCKCVTMDFAPAYAKAVTEVLPTALIVIDKFHAVQEVNRCLDNVRKGIQRQYISQGVNIKRFKNAKRLFMSNWENLTTEAEKTLSNWFEEFPELYEAYMCKEMFRDIYLYAETKETATTMFDGWLQCIPLFPEFSAMRKTMTKRRDHILNYWDRPYTNAYTESVNNAIKTIEKKGRGYRFDRLRELCILEINKAKNINFNHKEARYISDVTGKEEQRKKLYIKAIQKKSVEDKGFALDSSVYSFQVGYRYIPSDWVVSGSVPMLFELYTSLDPNESFKIRTRNF